MSQPEFDRTAQLVKSFERSLLALPDSVKANAYDIHLKAGQPLLIAGKGGVCFVGDKGDAARRPGPDTLICRENDMREIFLHLCSYSVFSHENEIRQGFVSTAQGYRVGLCGTAVTENGTIKNIKDISSLIFRVPREKPRCADPLFQAGISFSGGVLLVGEPSSGKTTLLRDIVRSLSMGLHTRPKRVAVLDERAEISGSYDLGPCADVLKACPKQEGFTLALRALSPEVIVCDELAEQDMDFVGKSVYSGVPVVATLHGNEAALRSRAALLPVLQKGGFETLVFLAGRENPTAILKIESVRDWLENNRRDDDFNQRPFHRAYEVAGAAKTGGFTFGVAENAGAL